MLWFRLRARLLAPLATPPQADTLFGHLCWALRYRDGEEALGEFLGRYDSAPPLVLSELFPAGWLPLPALDYPPECGAAGKPKLRWARAERVLAGRILAGSLREGQPECAQAGAMHNQIDRLTGRPREGGLFSREETWYPRGQALEMYLLADAPATAAWAADLLAGALRLGFGADKSAGRGAMEVDAAALQPFTPPDHGGRRLALAGFFPRAGECADLRGDTLTKFGRLGGHFANAPNPVTGTLRPFKKPVVLFRAGATCEPAPADHAGQLLSHVHPDARIRHYALTPLLPLGVGQEEGAW